MTTKRDILLTAAAAVLAMAGLTSCSNSEDNLSAEIPTAEKAEDNKTVTLTINVTREAGDESTRSLSYGTEDGLTKTWKDGEKVAYIYLSGSGWTKGESTISGVDGLSAKLTVELNDPSQAYTKVAFIYPASLATTAILTGSGTTTPPTAENAIDWDQLYNNQDGTLATLAEKFDLAFGSLDFSYNQGTAILPESLTLQNQLAIWIMRPVQESTTSPINYNKMVINVSSATYTITRSGAANSGVLFVAMKPVTSNQHFYFHAINTTNTDVYYRRTTTSKTLLKNKYYVSTGSSFDMKLAKYARGYLLATDGYPYQTVSDINAFSNLYLQTVLSGLITWSGNSSSYQWKSILGDHGNHCLMVLATRDAWPSKAESNRQLQHNAWTDRLNDTSTFNSMDLPTNVNTRPTGATEWLMPSAEQFQVVLDEGYSNGNKSTVSTLTTEDLSFGKGNINTLIQTAVGTGNGNLLSETYWMSNDKYTDTSTNPNTVYYWGYNVANQKFEKITTNNAKKLRPIFFYNYR